MESPVYPSPPVYSPGKQGFKSKSTSAPTPLTSAGGGGVVGFDSTSAAKSRRCKNESGLQEGKCPYSICPALTCRPTFLSRSGLSSRGLSGPCGVALAVHAALGEEHDALHKATKSRLKCGCASCLSPLSTRERTVTVLLYGRAKSTAAACLLNHT